MCCILGKESPNKHERAERGQGLDGVQGGRWSGDGDDGMSAPLSLATPHTTPFSSAQRRASVAVPQQKKKPNQVSTETPQIARLMFNGALFSFIFVSPHHRGVGVQE